MSREVYEEKVREAEAAIREYLGDENEAPLGQMLDDISPEPEIHRQILSAALCDMSARGEIVIGTNRIVRRA